MTKDFDFLAYNTVNGTVYAYVNGAKREIQKVKGRYCFISAKRVFEDSLNIAPIFKTRKYANFFNEESQTEIDKYINS